ncbi:MAG: PHP-associated domain-containing protein, partial [Gemmataceae bacterium]
RRVSSVREAFARYLHDRGEVNVPKSRLPVAEGISLIRGAGGVASWAHPFYDGTRQRLAELRRLGLQAIEVEYPTHRDSWKSQLRAWANELRLAITGGSDCHGPEPLGRVVGACGITVSELKHLRQLIP